MRFYTGSHRFYCGIDLHASKMYVCVVDADGKVQRHKNIRARPEPFLRSIQPFCDDLVVGVECMHCWYWLADLCAEQAIPFVLGHALYMKAVHGGKTKNDKIDSEKIARLLCGKAFPQAYVYPRRMRATRDLLRRRTFLVRKRAELLGHLRMTHGQHNLDPGTRNFLFKANREGLAARFQDPCVRRSMQLDLDLIEAYSDELRSLELHLEQTVKTHDPDAYYRLRSIPGVGKILAMVLLYEIHTIERFERVQNFLSYARLVRCTKESAGKRVRGSSGSKIGNAHLKWAFSEATLLFRRNCRGNQTVFDRLVKKHGKSKALHVLGAKLGRAVYYMLKRGKPFDRERFLATN